MRSEEGVGTGTVTTSRGSGVDRGTGADARPGVSGVVSVADEAHPGTEWFYHVTDADRAVAVLSGGLDPDATPRVAARAHDSPTPDRERERRVRELSESVFERIRGELRPGVPARAESVFLWPTPTGAGDHRDLYGGAEALRTVGVDAEAVCNTAPVVVADFGLVAVARAAARDAIAGDPRGTAALGSAARDYWTGAVRCGSLEAVRHHARSGVHEWPELVVPGTLPPGWLTPDGGDTTGRVDAPTTTGGRRCDTGSVRAAGAVGAIGREHHETDNGN
jgi:hypothetical protein